MSATDFVYNPTRVKFGTAALNWTSAAVNAMLVGSEYSPNPNHTTVSDIPAGAIIIRDVALTDKAITSSGVCYGIIPLMEALLSPIEVKAVILYVLGGDDDHSPLIYYSSTGVGFPFLAEGFDYYVTYDQANGGWFQA